jgi:hypothetical protein
VLDSVDASGGTSSFSSGGAQFESCLDFETLLRDSLVLVVKVRRSNADRSVGTHCCFIEITVIWRVIGSKNNQCVMCKEAYYILFSGVIGLCWQQFLPFIIGLLTVMSNAVVVGLWH